MDLIVLVCYLVGTYFAFRAGQHSASARWHHHMAQCWGALNDRQRVHGTLDVGDFMDVFGRPPDL